MSQNFCNRSFSLLHHWDLYLESKGSWFRDLAKTLFPSFFHSFFSLYLFIVNPGLLQMMAHLKTICNFMKGWGIKMFLSMSKHSYQRERQREYSIQAYVYQKSAILVGHPWDPTLCALAYCHPYLIPPIANLYNSMCELSLHTFLSAMLVIMCFLFAGFSFMRIINVLLGCRIVISAISL